MLDFIKTVLKKFTEDARMNKRGFFTTFFKTTPEDYTDGEYVEIDIERTGDYVAPALKDARTGSVVIDEDIFTEKRFKPPYSALSTPVPLMELLQRQPGESDTAEVRGQWFGRLVNKLTKSLSKFHRMFKEQIELQCSQILQTGVVTLKDADGNDVYTLDYKAKATHILANTNSWDGNNADPLGDLEGLVANLHEQDTPIVDADLVHRGSCPGCLQHAAVQVGNGELGADRGILDKDGAVVRHDLHASESKRRGDGIRFGN